MKLKKTLLLTATGLVLVVIIAVVAVVMRIDAIAKNTIERASTRALGVDTTVDSVEVGLLGGEFGFDGLTIANPEDFDAGEHFLKIGEGDTAVSFGDLRAEKVVIPSLELSDIELVLEKQGARSNYQTILDNVRAYQESQPPSEKKYVFERVVMRDVNVRAYLFAVPGQEPRPIDFKREEIVMHIDSEEGISIEELSNVILEGLLTDITANASALLPGLMQDSLAASLSQLDGLRELGIDLEGSELLDSITSQTGRLGERLSESVDSERLNEAIGGSEDQIRQGLKEGIGGFLGRDRERDNADTPPADGVNGGVEDDAQPAAE